ncbi:hypothetical protein V5E97_10170 [Singulisphaera sp. Ch08]|uniref:Uncharacterized protein n=1 Tax=Singulisphaera sp. Ch08 TaxID=3120278 RepID=A0AAU7CLU9_9BACT
MGYPLKQSQTAQPLLFLLVDSTDHITGQTGLSPTVTLSKNGGTFATPAGAVTELANGWYKVAGNATDTATLGPLLLHGTATGADPCDDRYDVVAYDPQSASLGLTLAKTTNITGFNDIAATAVVSGGAITTSGGAVSTVTTVGTLTTYTGNTPQTGDSFARIGANGAGLTALGDTRLANLDAAVSTRSTYAGADTSGTTTLLTRLPGIVVAQTGDAYALIGAAGAGLTALGDTRLANLDAAISTRSTYAGGAVASVTAAVTVGTNNDKSGYSLNLSQALTDVKTATVGGALHGAWASAWGKMVKDVAGKTLKLFGYNSQSVATVTFNLDDGTDPTSRTPQ